MKKTFPLLGILTATIIAVGTIYITAHYLSTPDNTAKAAPVAACPVHGRPHIVKFEDNQLVPQHTVGKLCDTMTIINEDNVIRLLAFGPHEHHTPYDGLTEKILEKGQSATVVLNQAGNYTFHDHFHDSLIGSLTVTN